MKIIDLLNKIANGEEVPKKIKYEDDIYILLDNYCYHCEKTNSILSYRIFAEQSRLNEQVEILEEEKKIPEKLEERYYHDEPALIDDMAHKINEIIDYLNYLKSKGE